MPGSFTDTLKAHAARYPLMTPQDAVKLCYQAEFGGGHLIWDRAQSLARLREEALAAAPQGAPLFESIGCGLMRVHLGSRAKLPSLETINGAFAHSAAAVQGSSDGFAARLDLLTSLCAQTFMPFGAESLAVYLADYRAMGCPMVSHSQAYRDAYAPAYRVLLARFESLWPALAQIDAQLATRDHVIMAIDGRCGSGKTTLGSLLQDVYGANLYHMDDFFLRQQQRTPERYAEPGGNVDRERFLAEVLMPLKKGAAFGYRPFHCGTMALGEAVCVKPARLEIVEGAYALHPDLRDAYDLKLFLDIDPAQQQARIRARNGEAMLRRFQREWIPMEERYFTAFHVRETCDLVLR